MGQACAGRRKAISFCQKRPWIRRVFVARLRSCVACVTGCRTAPDRNALKAKEQTSADYLQTPRSALAAQKFDNKSFPAQD